MTATSSPLEHSDWIVLKFGGTSVSAVKTWENIIQHTQNLLAEKPTQKVWIVVSALTNVTNILEKCVQEINVYKKHYDWIVERHYQLARDIGDLSIIDSKMKALFEELDQLLAGIQLTGDNASARLLGRVFSYGELMSSTIGYNILTSRLAAQGVSWIDARTCLFAEDRPNSSMEDRYLNANVIPKIDLESMENKLSSKTCRVAITQGFIATVRPLSSGATGGTCVLGRGGGDTSGALFACLLNARRFEVWTDVHGMFTSDPRHVKHARLLLEMSYREAQELAAMGAKVLHPRCLVPASFAHIPVEIHNTMDFENIDRCTRIVSPDMLEDKDTTVMAIARRLGQVLITLSNVEMWGASGFLSKAFEPFDRFGVSVDLIATSQYAVSLTLDYIPGGVKGEVFGSLLKELRKVAQVNVHESCAVVSIVGRRLRTVLHHMADAFKELAQYNVLLLSESTEDLNLSFVVHQEETSRIEELVVKLHKVLLEDRRGLPAPAGKASLFGSTLNQLLKIAPTTPDVVSRLVGSVGVGTGAFLPKIPELSLTPGDLPTVLNLSTVPSFPSCALFEVDRLSLIVPQLEVFPLDLSADNTVLKTVFNLNPEIKFAIRTVHQMHAFQKLASSSKRANKTPAGLVLTKVVETIKLDSVIAVQEQEFSLYLSNPLLKCVRQFILSVEHIDESNFRILLTGEFSFTERFSEFIGSTAKNLVYSTELSVFVESTEVVSEVSFEVYASLFNSRYDSAFKLLTMNFSGKKVEVGDRVIITSWPVCEIYSYGKVIPSVLC